MDTRKFPIGPFSPQDSYSPADISRLTDTLAGITAQYQQLVDPLTPADLAKTYRPGSWTVQQLVHHVADIQLLHFLRMKKALTEPDYREITLINMDGWATTADGLDAPVADSLRMLAAITSRYVYLAQLPDGIHAGDHVLSSHTATDADPGAGAVHVGLARTASPGPHPAGPRLIPEDPMPGWDRLSTPQDLYYAQHYTR